jgi:sterol desaturase/sphingolipid hydroxylase (fatty acid hydroxylase superfamily)
MPIGKFLYFGDFGAIPIAVALLTYLALSAHGLRAVPEWGFALLVGLVVWTFAEYTIHRFIYHHAPIFSALHDAHHHEPNALIGVPSFASSGFIILVCYAPLFEFAPVFAAGLTSGALLGYAGYMFVHHATHHWKIEPGDWLYEARMRHLSHHYYDSANFGIVTGFWDRVFGTVRARRDRLART